MEEGAGSCRQAEGATPPGSAVAHTGVEEGDGTERVSPFDSDREVCKSVSGNMTGVEEVDERGMLKVVGL